MEQQREWPDPIMPEDSDSMPQEHIQVVDDTRSDLLTMFAHQISTQIQFPVNTAFVHGLGVIASAMTKSFSYEYHGNDSPVNLYIITAQPPSTGKSGINKFYVNPVRNAFVDLNKKQQSKINKLESTVKSLKEELKKAELDAEVDALTSDLIQAKEKLELTPIYKYAVSNTTPEALEDLAFNQDNTWNIISDEAGAINVVIGNIYNEGSSANADIILQSWDGDWLSSNRISRKAGEGYVRGSIAVIAQDETLPIILAAGARGNGISERFLFYREDNLFGDRDHMHFFPCDAMIQKKYIMLINRLVFSDKTTFKFSDEAKDLIKINKTKIEPHLKDGGMYSNNMLRGAVGKMDKQVMKMACVLHVIENWNGKLTPLTVQESSVKWAIKIYKQLIKMYIHAADSQGFIGDKSEVEEMVKQFKKFLSKNKSQVSITSIRDLVKHKPIFKGRAKLSGYLRDNVLPICDKLNLCRCINGDVYINPKLGLLV